MKFAHLSTQPNISKIRKSGLHMGDGRRGRGVYAVPLMMLEREGVWDTGAPSVRPESAPNLKHPVEVARAAPSLERARDRGRVRTTVKVMAS